MERRSDLEGDLVANRRQGRLIRKTVHRLERSWIRLALLDCHHAGESPHSTQSDFEGVSAMPPECAGCCGESADGSRRFPFTGSTTTHCMAA
jgi:hypothetical protein